MDSAVDPRDLLALAVEAAHRAGEVLLGRFRHAARGVGTKSSPTDLVSDADRASEELVMKMLAARRPDDGVLTEEGDGRASSTGLTWVVDPLDGTVNFLFGIPTWCVSLAVEDSRGGLVGVVHDAVHGETFTAIRGKGARLNAEAITVSATADVSRALIGTGFAYDARARAAQAEILGRVLPTVRDVRRAGSAALDLAALSCGRLDGFYEAPVERWDKAAGTLLAREAGAIVDDLAAPHGLSTGVIAANPALFDALSALVRDG